MPASRDQVRDAVFRAIEDFNTTDRAAVPREVETVLLGVGGAVDSLGLVRLVLTVERRVQADLGIALSLTDEKAMSQRNSPFRSVGALIDYIVTCVDAER